MVLLLSQSAPRWRARVRTFCDKAWARTVCHEDGDVPERMDRSAPNASFVGCICGVDKRQRSSNDACRPCDRSAAASARPPKPTKRREVIERDGEHTHRSGQLARQSGSRSILNRSFLRSYEAVMITGIRTTRAGYV